MRVFITPILILLSLYLRASVGDGPVGARSAAMAHSSVCLYDVWSAHNNAGSLGYVRQAGAGAFYESRFLLKDLSQSGFAAVLPLKKGCFGMSYANFGNTLYHEEISKLSFGIALNEHISAGIAVDYLHVRISDVYGQTSAFTGDAGLLAKITKQLVFAVHVYNPFRAAVTNYNNEKIPTTFRMGLQYMFSKQVFLSIEAEKISFQKLNIKAGLEYTPAKTVYLRFGCASYPKQAAFGFGIDYKGVKIDLSSMYHQVLGFTPCIGLSCGLGKTKTPVSKS